MRKINIVFDIDGVLNADYFSQYGDDTLPETRLFFQKQGAIFRILDVNHYVPPGVIELIQLLFSLPYVKVSFFSSSTAERNSQFVKALLVKALGEEGYQNLMPKPKILSGDDVDSIHKMDSIQRAADRELQNQRIKRYGLGYNETKKNLLKILDEGDSLEDAILVDDEDGVIYYGQERSLLRSRWVQTSNYSLFRMQFESDLCVNDNFQRINGIFYLTGVLLDCFENRKTESVTERLLRLHYKKVSDDPLKYKTCFYETMKQPEYYEKGLRALQEINPDLFIITRETFNACVQPLIPEVLDQPAASAGLFRLLPTPTPTPTQSKEEQKSCCSIV